MIERGRLSYFQYGQEDIAELEEASVKVRHIIEKSRQMLIRYVAEPLRTSLTGASPDSNGEDVFSRGMFQKWVKGTSGWKFIDCEYEGLLQSNRRGPDSTGRLLQMFIWSQYENIRLLHPFLGNEPLFDGEELEVIGKYFVPTYSSVNPFLQSGKAFKTIRAGIAMYQEWIPAPAVIVESDGEELTGSWMTGVDLDSAGYAGIRPYLKALNGRRAFMEARIV